MSRLFQRVTPLRILAVATALGIFSSLQAYNYVSLFAPRKQPLWVLVALNVTYWYGWALLAPGILWFARRYPFGRSTWRKAAAMHCLGVVLFTFAHVVLAVTSRVVILRFALAADPAAVIRNASWWPVFRELFFLNFDWEMMTYWAVVGMTHALEFHQVSQERELAAAHLETRLAEAQLQALQRQLHPHFLFNTLHTISALMHRDTEAADAMLERLSDLLRLTLERLGTQQVHLKDEIDFVDKYLEIERARFGDRLRVDFDVEPGILDALVPNFLLQPLVENAVRHGIGPKIGGGTIRVSAHRDGPWLRMIVRDDGVGISSEKLQTFSTGVGLSNTRSRLEHLYGSGHTFTFDRPAGGGLSVTIAIPYAVASESMESVA